MTMFIVQPLHDGILIVSDSLSYTIDHKGKLSNPKTHPKIQQVAEKIMGISGGVASIGSIVLARLRNRMSAPWTLGQLESSFRSEMAETWQEFGQAYSDYSGNTDYMHVVVGLGGVIEEREFLLVGIGEWGKPVRVGHNSHRLVYPPVDEFYNFVDSQLDPISMKHDECNLFSPSINAMIEKMTFCIEERSKEEPSVIGGVIHLGVIRKGFPVFSGERSIGESNELAGATSRGVQRERRGY
jgi:hypothetical protein